MRAFRPLAVLVAAASLSSGTLLPAQGPRAAAKPAAGLVHGFSTARLARIDSAVERQLARDQIAGAVVLVLRDGRPVYERAFGWADREAKRRMTPDAIFRIASQTKAITSVAVMALVEEGKIALLDPVSRFIPAFEKTTVSPAADSGRRTVPATRQITIRDLLTHTAGISYGNEARVAKLYEAQGLGPAAGFGWYTADKDEPVCATMERLAALPFVAQPGERFVYGYATDVLGCVVERASGMPLDAFVRTRITEPLGMRDTHFFLPAEKATRFTAVYEPPGSAGLVRSPEGARGQGHYVQGPRKSFAGGAGLVSTARDYGRFLEMLRQGGALDGVRILAPSTVRLLTASAIGALYTSPGEGFSLGFRTLEQPGGGRGRPESVGTWAWGGAYGTQYQVDPVEGVTLLYMVQGGSGELGRLMPMLVYQALLDSRN